MISQIYGWNSFTCVQPVRCTPSRSYPPLAKSSNTNGTNRRPARFRGLIKLLQLLSCSKLLPWINTRLFNILVKNVTTGCWADPLEQCGLNKCYTSNKWVAVEQRDLHILMTRDSHDIMRTVSNRCQQEEKFVLQNPMLLYTIPIRKKVEKPMPEINKKNFCWLYHNPNS